MYNVGHFVFKATILKFLMYRWIELSELSLNHVVHFIFVTDKLRFIFYRQIGMKFDTRVHLNYSSSREISLSKTQFGSQTALTRSEELCSGNKILEQIF